MPWGDLHIQTSSLSYHGALEGPWRSFDWACYIAEMSVCPSMWLLNEKPLKHLAEGRFGAIWSSDRNMWSHHGVSQRA